MVEFEYVVWDRGKNSHSDPDAAKADGLSRRSHPARTRWRSCIELLEQNFGDAWVYGGKISIRYIRPVYEGDVLTPNGLVTETNRSDGSLACVSNLVRESGWRKTSVGTASAGQPVATTSWIQTEARRGRMTKGAIGRPSRAGAYPCLGRPVLRDDAWRHGRRGHQNRKPAPEDRKRAVAIRMSAMRASSS